MLGYVMAYKYIIALCILIHRQLLTDPPAVITLDEVGCGIVPLEKSERDYREAVGHAGQMLAAAAAEVYRMQCGIAVRIK